VVGRSILCALFLTSLGATAVAQERSLELEHLWTLPSLGDEYIIGAIHSVLELPDGELALLDRQTLEIHIVGPDGEYLRSIGREGGGPGEFRSPFGSVMTADGRIVVNDGGRKDFPALWPDGTAADSWILPAEYRDGAWISSGIMEFGEGLVMQLQGSSRDDEALSSLMRVFAVGADGSMLGELGRGEIRIPHGRDPVRFNFESQPVGPWGSHREGRAYYAPHRDRYVIEVYDASFEKVRVIEREQDPPRKPKDVLERERKDRDEFLREHPNGFYPEHFEHYPMIQGLRGRPGGVLWVTTGELTARVEAGELFAAYDVFDAQGEFVLTALIPGDHDSENDLVRITDKYLLFIDNGMDALRATWGGSPSEDDEEDLEESLELSVECYALPKELLALERGSD